MAFTVDVCAIPLHAAACAAFGVPDGDGPILCVAYQPGGIWTSHSSGEVAKYAVPSGLAKHHVDVSWPQCWKHPQAGRVMGEPDKHPPVESNSVPLKVKPGSDAAAGGVQTNPASSPTRELPSPLVVVVPCASCPSHPARAAASSSVSTQREVMG